jgi:hypothetical protein
MTVDPTDSPLRRRTKKQIREDEEKSETIRKIADLASARGGKRANTLAALERRSRNAWKSRSATTPRSGNPFLDALIALHQRHDIEPLLAIVGSGHPLTPRDHLVRLLELLHALGQARRPGKPSGEHLRWQNPNYIAAYLVDRRLNALRQATGRRRVSVTETERAVHAVINEMRGWALTQGKRLPRKERVLQLLREPKHRRL